MRAKLLALYIASILLIWPFKVFALKEATHRAMNGYTAQGTINGFSLDTYLINNVGFAKGSQEELYGYSEVYSNNVTQQIWKWLGEGGLMEDRPGSDWDFVVNNPTRSVNHFHNPLKLWSEAGLNDIKTGQSSILWAQNPNQSPGGNWSWQNARTYYYSALTATTKTGRDENFAKAFRAVGQQMHLVQDASVPEHVRNDTHILPGYEKYIVNEINSKTTDLGDSWMGSPITFDRAILDIPSPDANAQVPIARIIDADKYVGTNPGITKTYDGIPQVVGIAEYTNANFVSRNTIFNRNDAAHNFPYPRPEDTVLEMDNSNKREYLHKTTSGDAITHLAVQSIIHDVVPESDNVEKRLWLDSKCYEEYAEHLIPRAVGYSAGLLNYFFRGTLEISAPDKCLYGITDGSMAPYYDETNSHYHQTFTKIKAKVMNAPQSERFGGGTGTLVAVAMYKLRKDYQYDLSMEIDSIPQASQLEENYRYSVSAPLAVNAAEIGTMNGVPTEFTFDFRSSPIPAGVAELSLQVIFKGTIGNEADNAIAVGLKNIGEPTHHGMWNSVDYIYSGGALYPNNYPFSVKTEIALLCTPSDPISGFDVTYDAIPAGKYGRLITLSDATQNDIYWYIRSTPINASGVQQTTDLYYFHSAVFQGADPTPAYNFRGQPSHWGEVFFYYSPNGVWTAPWPTKTSSDMVHASQMPSGY